jgi:hypothetical protein
MGEAVPGGTARPDIQAATHDAQAAPFQIAANTPFIGRRRV